MAVPTDATEMYSCTFIALDKYSDLDSNKLSSMYFPCFMTHRMFPLFHRLCFSSQKHYFASAGGLKVKEGQRQQHNNPSTPKKERRGGKKKKKREENLTHNLRAHAACQIV